MSRSRAALSDADAHRLVEHFNDHRAEGLAALAHRHGAEDASAARLTGMDEEGVVLRSGAGGEGKSLRVSFAARAIGPDDARARLEALLVEASVREDP